MDDPPEGKRGTFVALRIRNYRLFASGQVISNVGTWMQRIAQDWLVLVLTGNDPVALGIATMLQFAPTLFFSLWAGVLADRMNKRKLLIGVLAGMASTALVLGLLDVTGVVVLWHVYALCLALGVFSAFEVPVRQSFVAEMVGRDMVPNAIAINSTTFNLARVVGPAVAGVMITWVGTGWVFLVNAISTCAVIAMLARMDPHKLHRTPAVPRQRGQLREGLRYVRHRTDILVVIVLVFFVSTFGITFFASLPIAAATVFHRDAAGYGLLSTMLAVGTLAGALLAVRRSARGRPRLRVLLGSAIAFGVLEIIAGLMGSYLAFAIALVPMGFAVMTFMTTANSTVQLAASPEMRGRVMGLYMLVFLGGNPIGGPTIGWLAAAFGGRAPFIVGGALAATAAALCGLFLLRKEKRGENVPRS
ncbi:putative MFS family arabinose efflux permease [Herbihabitans rhizosphaerae]|uniref:Putative MFS family arabinose efflux permease n=1 Tax=Herbihabitans rhizosphaerae TaxID=1872711 RepID=A0A4Q7KZ83_9PSEU|nr:MFS transporter [Herbihabitans rhizosphaerae]RZS41002.1 putative MFS family arabinose efflux permease [Herbihabitans rhizosphaerae]